MLCTSRSLIFRTSVHSLRNFSKYVNTFQPKTNDIPKLQADPLKSQLDNNKDKQDIPKKKSLSDDDDDLVTHNMVTTNMLLSPIDTHVDIDDGYGSP